MRKLFYVGISLILFSFQASQNQVKKVPKYCWKHTSTKSLKKFIPENKGFKRVSVKKGSFAEWLRSLPMQPKGTPIRLYNGKKKWLQLLNGGIVDIEVGTKDLQQCADAVIRLKAEYHYSKKEYSKIKFNLTNGMQVPFSKWSKGYRVKVNGNKTSWFKKYDKLNTSYKNFKSYLNFIFSYAGTYSLQKELKKTSLENIQIGDVFIKGGFPGHVIMIADIAQKGKDKEYLFIQSYMPAQNIHVIKNQNKPLKGKWFTNKQLKNGVSTVEWSYSVKDLRTW